MYNTLSCIDNGEALQGLWETILLIGTWEHLVFLMGIKGTYKIAIGSREESKANFLTKELIGGYLLDGIRCLVAVLAESRKMSNLPPAVKFSS